MTIQVVSGGPTQVANGSTGVKQRVEVKQQRQEG